MTNTPSPFDDPEFVEKLNRAGVTHRPGMAHELLEEIGPLLAAGGFDVNNPDQDMSLEDLNAAMAFGAMLALAELRHRNRTPPRLSSVTSKTLGPRC